MGETLKATLYKVFEYGFHFNTQVKGIYIALLTFVNEQVKAL